MERKWWTLLAACVATFTLLLDITVVNVALPDIQRDLDASLSSLQWVVDAYALTLAAFLLMTGSLGDRLGRRHVFNIGFGVFTLASFLCGIASDATLLTSRAAFKGSARRRCSRPRSTSCSSPAARRRPSPAAA
jgi:MFS family permease